MATQKSKARRLKHLEEALTDGDLSPREFQQEISSLASPDPSYTSYSPPGPSRFSTADTTAVPRLAWHQKVQWGRVILLVATCLAIVAWVVRSSGGHAIKNDPYASFTLGMDGSRVIDRADAAYGAAVEVKGRGDVSCWIWSGPDRVFCFNDIDGNKIAITQLIYKAKDAVPMWTALGY